MTDRELLELAAKAAGIGVWDDEHGNTWRVYYTDPNNGLNRYTRWRPLTDDRDALRLAVKLGIAPIQDQKEKVCAAYWTDTHCVHVAYNDDPYAATRRAIVQAAAEIGRAME